MSTSLDLNVVSYDFTETIGLSLALGPTMTVGRCSCSTVLTCTCGSLEEIV